MNVGAVKRGGPIPLPVIIIAFVAFWPVGILLFIANLTIDKTMRFKDSTVKVIMGIAWVLFGLSILLMLLGCISALGTDTMRTLTYWALALCIGGFFVRNYANKVTKIGLLYKQYIDIVANRQIHNIDTIAEMVRVPYARAVHDLKKMISQGYFNDAYVDELARVIVLPHMQQQMQQYQQQMQFGQAQFQTQQVQGFGVQTPPPQITSVTCPSCGANGRVIPGQVNECEYCGTFLGQ